MPNYRSQHDLAERVEHSLIVALRDSGLQEKPPLRVDCRVDRSVHYIGAVTNVYKEEILKKPTPDPSFINQVCFRTRNAAAFLSEDAAFRWGSLFYMIGGVCDVGQASDLYRTIACTLKILCKEVGAHIVVSCPDDVSVYDSSQFDREDIPNTQEDWKYGDESLFGRGSTFFIKNGERNFEVGNIIDIYRNGRLWGVEFGFGVETISSALLRSENAIIIRPIASHIICDSPQRMIMADCVESSLLMKSCGVSIGSRDKPRVFRNYLKSLQTHLVSAKLSVMELHGVIHQYSVDIGHELEDADYIVEYVAGNQ